MEILRGKPNFWWEHGLVYYYTVDFLGRAIDRGSPGCSPIMGIHLAINALLLNQNECLFRLQRWLTILEYEYFVTLLLQTINDPVEHRHRGRSR